MKNAYKASVLKGSKKHYLVDDVMTSLSKNIMLTTIDIGVTY